MGDGLLEILAIEVDDGIDDAEFLAFADEDVGGRKDVLFDGRRPTNQSIRSVGVDLVQHRRERRPLRGETVGRSVGSLFLILAQHFHNENPFHLIYYRFLR